MNLISKHYRLILFSIPFISLLLHWHVFNLDLVGIHVWRQTETQQVIDNFYREDFNILHSRVNNMSYPDRRLYLEFPIMQWLFAVFYKLFGAHIIISRILSFILGLFSVYGMYHLADRIFKNRTTATIGAWCFTFSPVFHYYTLNPMPDNFSLCFSIWALGFFYDYTATSKLKYVLFSALCFGLAVMAKLPFILYATLITAYFIVRLKNKAITLNNALAIAAIYIVLIIPAILWYATVIPKWRGMVVLKGIFDVKQSSRELLHIFSGMFISVLPELLINYGSVLFFIASVYYLIRGHVHYRKYSLPLIAWGISILFYIVFELNTINTVHDYYLFPVLPPIFILVAFGASRLLPASNIFLKSLSLICLLSIPILAMARTCSRWDAATDPGFNPAFYRYKDEIRKLTPKDALCVVGADQSDMTLLYYIDRKGWAYSDNQLNDEMLAFCITRGAKYLYTTDDIDSKLVVKIHIAEKIFDKENLRVYKLK